MKTESRLLASKRSIFLVGAGVVLAVDALTKWVVRENFYLGRSVEVIGDLFRLTYILNPGAAFGIHVGPYSRIVFTALASLAVAVLATLYWQTPRSDRLRLYSLALVLGGALGNLVDRVRSPGAVVDFLDVGLGAVRWPVFNVADVAVTTGALLLALSLWQEPEEAPARTDGGDRESAGADRSGIPRASDPPGG